MGDSVGYCLNGCVRDLVSVVTSSKKRIAAVLLFVMYAWFNEEITSIIRMACYGAEMRHYFLFSVSASLFISALSVNTEVAEMKLSRRVTPFSKDDCAVIESGLSDFLKFKGLTLFASLNVVILAVMAYMSESDIAISDPNLIGWTLIGVAIGMILVLLPLWGLVSCMEDKWIRSFLLKRGVKIKPDVKIKSWISCMYKNGKITLQEDGMMRLYRYESGELLQQA